jgi:hypothetical protein
MAYFKELSWHVLRRLEENRIENTLASIWTTYLTN